MWDIAFVQAAFFAAVSVVFFLAVAAETWRDRLLLAGCVAALVGGQLVFLTNGDAYDRIWEETPVAGP